MNNNLKIFLFFILLLILQACSLSDQDLLSLEDQYLSNNSIQDVDEKISYLEAISNFDSELYSISKKNFQKFNQSYPNSSMHSEAVLRIADCDFYAGSFPEAIAAYENYIKTFPNSERNPWARKQISFSHLSQYKGIERDQKPLTLAAQSFKNLLEKYPGNPYEKEAINTLQKLKEKKAAHEVRVITFYLKQNKLNAAASRLAYLRRNFSNTSALLELEEIINEEDFSKKENLERLYFTERNNAKKDVLFDF